jgi:hypothetical protein
MKKHIYTFCILFFTINLFSQSNDKTVELVFSENPMSLDFIKNKCFLSSPSLYSIFKQNVFKYYDLNQYDTELKQATFKKTIEYQNYLSELIKIKANVSNSIYYIRIEDVFVNCNYDIKKQGFDIELCVFDFGMLASNTSQQKIIYLESSKERIKSAFSSEPRNNFPIEENLIRIKSIPSRTIHSNKLSQSTAEKVFISMSEENGLKIEENKYDIELYLLFTPKGIEQLSFPFLKSKSSKSVLVAEKTRMIVCNKKTGVVYYDKIY